MLAVSRKAAIKELLQENKSVMITDLAERLNVTKETIRRDLRDMEKNNELIRTHGGAYILDGVQNELDISTRKYLKMDEKERIAEKCLPLLETGDIVYLDESTTAWSLAKKIAGKKLTVMTTSLEIANILSHSTTIKLHLIGGRFYPQTNSFIGDNTIQTLNNYFFDKAFISCRSMDMTYGVTDTTDNIASIRRTALAHAKQKYLIIDHTKLDNTSFTKIIPISELDGVIMDDEFSPEWKEYLRSNLVKYY